MADEKQAIEIQLELLTYAVHQTGYLQEILRKQAETLALLKKLPKEEAEAFAADVVSDAQEAIKHDLDGIRKLTGWDVG
jgi:hypothetical protein